MIAPRSETDSEQEVRAKNRCAWDGLVKAGNRWTIPVTPAQIEEARAGRFEVLLTPTRPVPREWFLPLAGLRVLGLAAAGGQQGPLLAAAGANMTRCSTTLQPNLHKTAE